jgi:hypothetical protein
MARDIADIKAEWEKAKKDGINNSVGLGTIMKLKYEVTKDHSSEEELLTELYNMMKQIRSANRNYYSHKTVKIDGKDKVVKSFPWGADPEGGHPVMKLKSLRKDGK